MNSVTIISKNREIFPLYKCIFSVFFSYTFTIITWKVTKCAADILMLNVSDYELLSEQPSYSDIPLLSSWLLQHSAEWQTHSALLLVPDNVRWLDDASWTLPAKYHSLLLSDCTKQDIQSVLFLQSKKQNKKFGLHRQVVWCLEKN